MSSFISFVFKLELLSRLIYVLNQNYIRNQPLFDITNLLDVL